MLCGPYLLPTEPVVQSVPGGVPRWSLGLCKGCNTAAALKLTLGLPIATASFTSTITTTLDLPITITPARATATLGLSHTSLARAWVHNPNVAHLRRSELGGG